MKKFLTLLFVIIGFTQSFVYCGETTERDFKVVQIKDTKTDAEIATETFKYLFNMGNKLATKFYNKKKKECKEIGISFYGKGIKNCFLIGFLDGIAEILEKQCTALMIVTPKEVEEAFKERTKDCKTTKNRLNTRSYYAKESWEEGKRSGKNAIGSRQLAMA